MIDRLTRIQLMIFAVVTVLTVGAISVFYLRVPEAVGVGSYKVTANFVAGGGLYENANVTYRGVTVGRVESVGLSDDGVVAHMRLQSGTPVPENVTATVKSVSAIGEQYIDLVPPEQPAQAMLSNGADIGMDRTAIGQDIYGLLQQADALVSSVGDSRIQDLLDETFKAFNGSGPELARLIQSSRLLIDEANANYGQTTQLIDQVGPFLEAQVRSGDDIRSLSEGLARFTTEVADADPQLRSVLQTVPDATEAANTTFEGIRPTFPVLAANLANFGRIGVIYNKSLEHSLVVFPALIAALNTVAGGVPPDEGGKLDFKVDLGDPPPCSVGFIPPPQIRSPADTTLRELPTDLYCKVAQNDPSVVRGARNYPCQEFPGKRAPTIQLCRDPKGYVPIGTNPWRGPPIPYGTPMDQREDNHYEPPGRNTFPPNKFPFIPPEMDPDPGPPSVQLPPGVEPGPGPAPHAPYPLPVPPNEPDQLPPPWPYFSPPDQVVPPYGRTPPAPAPGRAPAPFPAPAPAPAPPPPPPAGTAPLPAEAAMASGPAMASYDQNGEFVDPAGGTGIYAPGTDKLAPAENWVDLMLSPKQA
ncbi:MCE family protein [Mycolicibacterium hippocampi]|uniref:MCE family protein n=1 Tax=Mycolicibacterium hippocampi TaxID=659824 RepID=UPI003518D893